MANDIFTIYRDLDKLHPAFAENFLKLTEHLETHAHELGCHFRPFETWRSHERQMYLYATGKSKIKTRGAHHYGLAIDYAVWTRGSVWSWDMRHPWHILHANAAAFGLTVPIRWDACHVEAPSWRKYV